MRIPLIFLILLLSSSASLRRKHPFYVSMTEIEWKPADRRFEIAVRIFTDDLEKALAAKCRCKTDLNEQGRKAETDKLLEAYLSENLRISATGKTFKASFLGREKEEESTWCFLEADASGFSGKLRIDNTLLHAIQDKQVNLIRFRKPGYDETIQLRYPDTRHDFP